jgi:antitoxin VapB
LRSMVQTLSLGLVALRTTANLANKDGAIAKFPKNLNAQSGKDKRRFANSLKFRRAHSIYKTVYTIFGNRQMTRYARVFQSGNSQAVRLPKEFRLDVERVEVSREGDAIILRPDTGEKQPWASLRAARERGFSPDFMEGGREQPDEQERPDLDTAFR